MEQEEQFQQFEPKNAPPFVLISNQLTNEMVKDKIRCVHKYLPIDYFIDSIIHRYFYMASPSEWDDPFETKYLDVLNDPDKGYLLPEEVKKKLNDMSIFCTCMTYNDSDSEEASWKSYGDNKEQIIRVSFNFDKLCEILNGATSESIYVGKLCYKTREYIIKPKVIVNNENRTLEHLYVNNFCFKQEAYQYEKELRFCVIKNGEQFKKEKEYKIEHIELLPAVDRITLPPINFNKMTTEESKKKIFEQVKKFFILKALCPKVSIHVSNLYNSNEIEMTSELLITNNQNNY